MELSEILSHVDHTLLKPECTWEQVKNLCDEGLRYHTASVCIPPSYVKRASEYLGGKLPVCTVIGFPNGYSTTAVKVFETKDAVANGADEIDMVIDLGMVKSGDWDGVLEQICAVREVCPNQVLKVIIETCLLTDEEKEELCFVVARAGADYIKTSTGFSTGGATPADVALLAAHSAPRLKVKAAGGISSIEDGAEMIRMGADRLGTSRLVKLAEEAEESAQR